MTPPSLSFQRRACPRENGGWNPEKVWVIYPHLLVIRDQNSFSLILDY